MPVLPNMNLITPTLGGDSGTWDDKINACLALIDAHDHASGRGVSVNVDGITIDEDLSLVGFGLTNVSKISFSTIAAPSTGSKNLYVSSADNELYWRTNAGVNVKLTNGTSINTTLVGGIVGDYSSVGAEVSYSDADQVYTFMDENAKWARLAGGTIRIYQHDTTESVYVEHAVDAALAAPYTVTWPTAVPGSTSMMQISAAGVVSFSNTLAANQSVTVSGTGEYKHGEKVFTFPIGTNSICTTGTLSHAAGSHKWVLSAGGIMTIWSPLLRVGWRLKSVTIKGTSAGAGLADLGVYCGGTLRTGTNVWSTSGDYTTGSVTMTFTTPYVVQESDILEMNTADVSAVDFYDVNVTYDIV